MSQKIIALAISAVAIAAFSSAAAAETVFKCGANYSQSPCEGAITLQTDASRRDASAVKASQDATQRQAKLANQMEQARLKEEAKPIKYYIAPQKVGDDGGSTKKVEMNKPGKVQYFTAKSSGDTGSTKKKKKGKKKA